MEESKTNHCAGLRVNKLLAQSFAARERGFRKAFKRCRRHCSERTVHELRVSSRRLIATLEVLGSIVSIGEIEEARRALKKLLRLFGPLRDAHIRLLYFEELLPQFPALEKPFRAAAQQEQDFMEKVGRVLRRTKLGSLAKQLARVRFTLNKKLRNAASADQLRTLRAVVDEAFGLVQHRRGRVDAADVSTIHRVRVAFKKFRYMAEALQRLLPRMSERRLEAMRNFQARLGDIQDLEVIAGYLRDYAMERKPKFRKVLAPALHELQMKHDELIRTFVQNQSQLDRFRPSPKRHSRAWRTPRIVFKSNA